jgi:hypothetical protein
MRSVLASPYATHQREPVCLPQVPTHLEERDYRGPSPRIQHFLSIWHGPAPALPLLRKGDLRLIHGDVGDGVWMERLGRRRRFVGRDADPAGDRRGQVEWLLCPKCRVGKVEWSLDAPLLVHRVTGGDHGINRRHSRELLCLRALVPERCGSIRHWRQGELVERRVGVE